MTGEKIAVISLGCSKNLVDSERLMRMLENVGEYEIGRASCRERV